MITIESHVNKIHKNTETCYYLFFQKGKIIITSDIKILSNKNIILCRTNLNPNTISSFDVSFYDTHMNIKNKLLVKLFNSPGIIYYFVFCDGSQDFFKVNSYNNKQYKFNLENIKSKLNLDVLISSIYCIYTKKSKVFKYKMIKSINSLYFLLFFDTTFFTITSFLTSLFLRFFSILRGLRLGTTLPLTYPLSL